MYVLLTLLYSYELTSQLHGKQDTGIAMGVEHRDMVLFTCAYLRYRRSPSGITLVRLLNGDKMALVR